MYDYEDYLAEAIQAVQAWPFETEGEFLAAVNDQARLLSKGDIDLCPDCPAADAPRSATA